MSNIKNFEYANKKTASVSAGYSEGLKAYTRKVFNYMMLSLGLTALVSYLMIRTNMIRLFVNPETRTFSGLAWIVMFAPLAIVLFMRFSKSMTARGAKISLFSIAALEGAAISLLILYAGVYNAFQAFLLTGILFGGMSLYGYTTKRDLLKMGSILMMGVLGLVVVSIFGIFFGGIGIWFSYLVVIIFTGLVAYEVQLIKNIYASAGGKGEEADKMAVFCALNLYLSFINIFTALLRIMGNRS